MPTEGRSEETQLKTLRGLIAETQSSSPRFAGELVTFADAFAETCGHNRLEQIGLLWSAALTPAQTQALISDRRTAVSFASHLHRVLMEHLLPPEHELDTLPKAAIMQWIAALRMGIQGVLRRRAQVSGDISGSAHFMMPSTAFLESIQPVIRRAADDFFGSPTDTISRRETCAASA